MKLCSLGHAWQTGDRRQERSGEELGGRGIPLARHDDQEEAQGLVQEHDEVPEAKRESGQATGKETEVDR